MDTTVLWSLYAYWPLSPCPSSSLPPPPCLLLVIVCFHLDLNCRSPACKTSMLTTTPQHLMLYNTSLPASPLPTSFLSLAPSLSQYLPHGDEFCCSLLLVRRRSIYFTICSTADDDMPLNWSCALAFMILSLKRFVLANSVMSWIYTWKRTSAYDRILL